MEHFSVEKPSGNFSWTIKNKTSKKKKIFFAVLWININNILTSRILIRKKMKIHGFEFLEQNQNIDQNLLIKL